MIHILIGHRGVGKTRLLKRLQTYFPHSSYYDLDQWIASEQKQSISDIFSMQGESAFRQMEVAALQQLLNLNLKEDLWICLGAGFPLETLSRIDQLNKLEHKIYWIRRATDEAGRVFTDRPRLKVELTPLEESLALFPEREKKYLETCHFIYEMPEGVEYYQPLAAEIEKSFFSDASLIELKNGIITIESECCEPKKLKALLSLHTKYKLKFELRNDLLDEKQLSLAIQILSAENCIYSFRKIVDPRKIALNFSQFARVDVDHALFVQDTDSYYLTNPNRVIISFHQDRLEALEIDFIRCLDLIAQKKLNFEAFEFKFSPLLSSFKELKRFDLLFTKYGSLYPVSVLPRSDKKAGWQWYRLYQQSENSVHFIKYYQGSAYDQPNLFQTLVQAQFFMKVGKFATVMGAPVRHSLSPAYHWDFFKKINTPYFFIEVSEDEFDFAIEYLKEKGLVYASITSPLKQKASQLANTNSKSINTLYFHNNKIEAKNTDALALEKIIERVVSAHSISSPIAVWGGQGILDSLKSLPYKFDFISAQSLSLKEGSASESILDGYELLIWAAPMRKGEDKDYPMPRSDWRPKVVLDLNYFDNSVGREYYLHLLSIEPGTLYISGLEMFELQAQEQQKFWRSYERE